MRAPNWLGDAVMTLPALAALRGQFPRAHLAVLAKPWVADIYRGQPGVDELIPYQGSRREIAARVRQDGFDCAVLLPNSFDSALTVWMAGVPTRIGYRRDGRGLLLTRAVWPPEPGEIPRHERFYYLELLRRAGLIETLPPAEYIRMAADAASDGPPVVGVSPGAAYGGAKRWLPERFAEAADRLAGELGGSIALFGSPGERALCEQIAAMVTAPVHNYAGETTLAEFIRLAAGCRVFLTNDSGPMHVASALGVPTVAVFGATDHTTTGPAGSHATVVRRLVRCSPCLLRECPIDHRCMTSVTVDHVIEAALQLLREQK